MEKKQEDKMAKLTDRPAVSFRLQDVDGREHTLSDYRGLWLLMVFHRHLG
jgi:peroxiredoxin